MATDKLEAFFQQNRRKGRTTTSIEEVNEVMLEGYYRRKLTEISLARFKWINVPEKIDKRFIEYTLFHNGTAVFFKHPKLAEYMVMRGSGYGQPNAYDNPTRFQCIASGMQSVSLRYAQSTALKECVPIYSNDLRMPDAETVAIYARRLARVDRTLDINTTKARNPRVFKGDQDMRLSAANVNRQIEAGSEFLQMSSQLAESMDTLDMGVDVDVFEKLHTYRARLYNECMGFLGIDNANQEKKERLIEGEVEANEEQVDIARAVNMNARKRAVEEIRALYPDLKNIDVKWVGEDRTITMQSPGFKEEDI